MLSTLSKQSWILIALGLVMLLVITQTFLPTIGMLFASTQAGANPLFNANPPKAAPADQALLNDNDVMRASIRTYGPVATMAALEQVTRAAGVDCHNRAHVLGRLSFEQFGEDAFTPSIPQCHSGYYHGSMEAYFRKNGTAHLADQLSFLCKDSLNAFFKHQCLHGIGHGLMAWSDYDLPSALEYCGMIPSDGGKGSCRTGVFMENIVGGLDDSPEARKLGHVSKYLSDDPQYPCSIVKEAYKSDCYFLQTDRMLALGKNQFEAVARDCEAAPDVYHRSCFGSMGRTVGGSMRDIPEKAIATCELAKAIEDRTECILGAAQDTFWDPSGKDAALHFCSLIPEDEGRLRCYAMMAERARDVLSSEDLPAYCDQLPVETQSACKPATPQV